MNSQFNQPKGSTSWNINHKAVARSANVAESAVVFSTETTVILDNKTVIYDEAAQKIWAKPSGIPNGAKIISVSGSSLTYTGPVTVTMSLVPIPALLDFITSLSASDGERLVGEASNIAALRNIEPKASGQRITLKEHTAGTGYGGGQFRAVMSATSYTDNNGTVIKTTGGNAWVRINADIVNPLMFGAVPRVDDTTPQAHVAINAAVVAASGRIFDGLGYTFNVGNEINFANSVSTIQRNIGINAIQSAAIGNIIRVNNALHTLTKINISGNNTDLAIGINQSDTAAGSIIENCRITNCGRSGIFTAGDNSIVRNNYTNNCGYAGTGNFRCSIQMNEGSNLVMEGNTCLNAIWGILIRNQIGSTVGYYNTMRNNVVVSKTGTTSDCQGISASAQRGLTTSGNVVRNFPNNGIDHQNCFNMNIINNHVISCADGVFIGDRSCGRIIISGNNIESCNTGVRYYNPAASEFTGQAFSDVQITNNIFFSTVAYGIWVIMSGTTSGNYLTRVDGNIVDGQASGGLGIVLDTVTVGSCCNNQVRRVNGHGINMTACDGLRVSHNTLLDCGYGTTGTYNGINASTCTRCDITHNIAIGASMVYAVNVVNGGQNLVDFNIARSTSGATATLVTTSSGTINGSSQIKG